MTNPPASPTAPTPDGASTSRCPNCGASASGRFCSSCGTALAGATCSTCSATLTPGARYCHRCGTPSGAPSAAPSRGFASALPWAVAALALVSLTALVVGQRFGSRSRPPAPNADVLGGPKRQGATPIGPGASVEAAPAAGGPAG